LLTVVFISLLIPACHFNINIEENRFVESFSYWFKMRSNYETIWLEYDDFSQDAWGVTAYNSANQSANGEAVLREKEANRIPEFVNFRNILYLVFCSGLLVQLLKFIAGLRYIQKIYNKGVKRKINNVLIIDSKESIAPFSFFQQIYLNQSILSKRDCSIVLAHEIQHVKQGHSVDQIIMQLFCMFHWFHPFAWLHKRALQETNEFLADKYASEKTGSNITYQESLLKQSISNYSFELANFFNIKPLKRRITMMTKKESNKKAGLKVFVALPMAALLFMLFANLTVSKSNGNFTNSYSNFPIKQAANVQGIWECTSCNDFADFISFDKDEICILKGEEPLACYEYEIKDNELVLKVRSGRSALQVKYDFKTEDGKFVISEKGKERIEYTKCPASNTLDYIISKNGCTMELPKIHSYGILEKTHLVNNIIIKESGSKVTYVLNGIEYKASGLNKALKKVKADANPLDLPFLTSLVYADKNTDMKHVSELKNALREANMLKVAWGGTPADDCPEVLYHKVGLTNLLPSKDAEYLTGDKLKKAKPFIVKMEGRKYKAGELYKELSGMEKYIVEIAYSNSTPYEVFLNNYDVCRQAIYQMRDEYSKKQYDVSYADLGNVLQKKVRKKIPMAITMNDR